MKPNIQILHLHCFKVFLCIISYTKGNKTACLNEHMTIWWLRQSFNVDWLIFLEPDQCKAAFMEHMRRKKSIQSHTLWYHFIKIRFKWIKNVILIYFLLLDFAFPFFLNYHQLFNYRAMELWVGHLHNFQISNFLIVNYYQYLLNKSQHCHL